MIGLKAKSVLTVEYMKVTTDHPLLSYMHPDTVAEAYLKGISMSQYILSNLYINLHIFLHNHVQHLHLYNRIYNMHYLQHSYS